MKLVFAFLTLLVAVQAIPGQGPGYQPPAPGYQPPRPPGYQPRPPGYQPPAPGYRPQNPPGYRPGPPSIPPPRPACPQGPSGCFCTDEFSPVCSTQGCDYGNLCRMLCAKGTLAYRGNCKRPSGGYGGSGGYVPPFIRTTPKSVQ